MCWVEASTSQSCFILCLGRFNCGLSVYGRRRPHRVVPRQKKCAVHMEHWTSSSRTSLLKNSEMECWQSLRWKVPGIWERYYQQLGQPGLPLPTGSVPCHHGSSVGGGLLSWFGRVVWRSGKLTMDWFMSSIPSVSGTKMQCDVKCGVLRHKWQKVKLLAEVVNEKVLRLLELDFLVLHSHCQRESRRWRLC